ALKYCGERPVLAFPTDEVVQVARISQKQFRRRYDEAPLVEIIASPHVALFFRQPARPGSPVAFIARDRQKIFHLPPAATIRRRRILYPFRMPADLGATG